MKTLLKIPARAVDQTENLCALPLSSEISTEGTKTLRSYLSEKTNKQFPTLTYTNIDLSLLNGNIENFIGMSQVPTGIIGPLKV
ncbi:MAG: hypothetical protein ACN6PN_22305, partial [Sphingobacterium sp.]